MSARATPWRRFIIVSKTHQRQATHPAAVPNLINMENKVIQTVKTWSWVPLATICGFYGHSLLDQVQKMAETQQKMLIEQAITNTELKGSIKMLDFRVTQIEETRTDNTRVAR